MSTSVLDSKIGSGLILKEKLLDISLGLQLKCRACAHVLVNSNRLQTEDNSDHSASKSYGQSGLSSWHYTAKQSVFWGVQHVSGQAFSFQSSEVGRDFRKMCHCAIGLHKATS